MEKKTYRLGEFLITEYDESLFVWESHIALGEQRSGRCNIIGNILVIEQWDHQEPGYLIMEFQEHLEKSPFWDKTKYYCLKVNIQNVIEEKTVVNNLSQQQSKKNVIRLEPKKELGFGDCCLGKFRININLDGKIKWQTYREANRVESGQCVIESGILFIKPKENEMYESQNRKKWNLNRKSLPKWDKTFAWGYWEGLKKCKEEEELEEPRQFNWSIAEKKGPKVQKLQPPFKRKTPSSSNEITSKFTDLLKMRWFQPVKENEQLNKISQLKNSVILKDILPFICWFVLLIFSVVSIDYLLHQLNLVWIGKYLGIPGIFILAFSFIYSARKRRIIEVGSLKMLLSLHVYLAWIGTLLIMVHAGIHFNAVLPWSAFILMLFVVISGLVGRYLLNDAKNTLRIKYEYLLNQGYSEEQIEKKAFLDALTVKAMTKWRLVHKPITLLFSISVALHITTIMMFWSWFQ
ncbi:MAG: hypothetical protein HOD92_09100 [Deltaproteobacteria bacterium]|jgi:hypothetical protein|nr:hypothetical protein [Deltaproteobacteria bacterium]MBT4526729.1 hypothetical protein [Deltaproteobacteria bacterium]